MYFFIVINTMIHSVHEYVYTHNDFYMDIYSDGIAKCEMLPLLPSSRYFRVRRHPVQSLSVAKVLFDRKIIFKTRQVASFERWTGKDRKTKNLAISTKKKSTNFKILIHLGGGGG